jgi:hypothetical protein
MCYLEVRALAKSSGGDANNTFTPSFTAAARPVPPSTLSDTAYRILVHQTVSDCNMFTKIYRFVSEKQQASQTNVNLPGSAAFQSDTSLCRPEGASDVRHI